MQDHGIDHVGPGQRDSIKIGVPAFGDGPDACSPGSMCTGEVSLQSIS